MAQKRGTKKGIIITVAILAAITLASFTFWFLPQGNNQVLVVTDFEAALDETRNIHQTIKTSVEEKFQDLLDGNITPSEFRQVAEVSSSQTRDLIVRLLQTTPPEEWQKSYQTYVESLRTFNSYLRETVVATSLLEEKSVENMTEDEKAELDKLLEKIENLKEQSESLEMQSTEARP